MRSTTPITQLKLQHLNNDWVACLAALNSVPESELSYTPLAEYSPTASCPLIIFTSACAASGR